VMTGFLTTGFFMLRFILMDSVRVLAKSIIVSTQQPGMPVLPC